MCSLLIQYSKYVVLRKYFTLIRLCSLCAWRFFILLCVRVSVDRIEHILRILYRFRLAFVGRTRRRDRTIEQVNRMLYGIHLYAIEIGWLWCRWKWNGCCVSVHSNATCLPNELYFIVHYYSIRRYYLYSASYILITSTRCRPQVHPRQAEWLLSLLCDDDDEWVNGKRLLGKVYIFIRRAHITHVIA